MSSLVVVGGPSRTWLLKREGCIAFVRSTAHDSYLNTWERNSKDRCSVQLNGGYGPGLMEHSEYRVDQGSLSVLNLRIGRSVYFCIERLTMR